MAYRSITPIPTNEARCLCWCRVRRVAGSDLLLSRSLNHLLCGSPIRSFARSPIGSLARSLARLSPPSKNLLNPSARLPVCSLTFAHSHICSPVRSLAHLLAQLLARSLTRSLAHPFAQLFAHSLARSLVRSVVWRPLGRSPFRSLAPLLARPSARSLAGPFAFARPLAFSLARLLPRSLTRPLAGPSTLSFAPSLHARPSASWPVRSLCSHHQCEKSKWRPPFPIIIVRVQVMAQGARVHQGATGSSKEFY